MSYLTKRAERRHVDELEQAVPDSLKTPDGVAIPVWDAAATDPIDYLASVMHLLPGSRTVKVAAGD